MKALLGMVLSLVCFSASAVDMNVTSCWKGFSNQEQQKNLKECQQNLRDLQICSTNLWEHKHAAFDVCLMEAASRPTQVVQRYQGFSQKDQDRNFAACKAQEGAGKICVKNAWIHGQAAYDVCLMQ